MGNPILLVNRGNGNGFQLLETITLTETTSEIVFSGITAENLLLVVSARSNVNDFADAFTVYMNGVSSGYSGAALIAFDGNATGTFDPFMGFIPGSNAPAGAFGNSQVVIPDAQSSSKKKVFNFQGGSIGNVFIPSNAPITFAGSTFYNGANAAITSLEIVLQTGTGFVANSSFSLYGF